MATYVPGAIIGEVGLYMGPYVQAAWRVDLMKLACVSRLGLEAMAP